MKKIIIKNISIIVVFFLLISFVNCVYGEDVAESSVKTLFSGADVTSDETGIKIADILSAILDILRIVGAAIAVVILMIIGAKYLVSSAGERADIKKYAFNYLIGAFILFGASGVLTLIKNIVLD